LSTNFSAGVRGHVVLRNRTEQNLLNTIVVVWTSKAQLSLCKSAATLSTQQCIVVQGHYMGTIASSFTLLSLHAWGVTRRIRRRWSHKMQFTRAVLV